MKIKIKYMKLAGLPCFATANNENILNRQFYFTTQWKYTTWVPYYSIPPSHYHPYLHHQPTLMMTVPSRLWPYLIMSIQQGKYWN